MHQEMTCGWKTGTAMSGPATCGKPAKAETNSPSTSNGLVCGVHARSARTQSGVTVTDLPGPDVRPGQVWMDNDPRVPTRYLRVLSVTSAHAEVVQTDRHGVVVGKERKTRIRLDRFRPTSTGYRLVTDVQKESATDG